MKKHLLWLLALIWSATALGETITVARALEICGGLASGASTTESYTIEGYVNQITNNSFSTTYNNMTFWIADTKGSLSSNASGAFYVYRGRPDVELQVGDKISVTSVLKNYNGTYETGTTNCPVTLLHRQTVLTERDTTFGSLRICAQNLENYYITYNTGRGNYSQDEINAKTNKIVNMMLTINADIYAFCEVEAKPAVLTYLANAANSAYGANVFVAVSDGIDEDWDATYNNNIKSGFIYRSDRVAPVGSNNAIYSANYYCNTMRYQAFQQLSNGEKLVVSMNHFKAKDSSSDQGESTRLTNANRLVNTLSTVTTDPDILILGDLNCQYGEAPITYIMNAGYAEQILRFDSTNYSHCYGGGELIDHVIANSSMEQQIVDAYVRHLSTTCSTGVTSDMSYSDHDPYVVEINLSSSTTPSSITTCAAAAQAALSVSANNELYNNGATYTIRGYVTAIQTAYNSSYGNITFWMADTQNGGKVLEAYRCSADASAVPNVGDYVEVTGNLTKYNTTPEFASGCSCQVIYTSAPPVNLGAKTIYEFLQLKNIKDTCVLTGIVENIVMDGEDPTQYNKFGNFYINDGTGSLYIYGLLTADGQTQQFRTMGIDEGDTLTLKAVYAEYNSNPQAANAIYVSHSKFVSTNWGPVTVKLDPTSVETYNWGNVGIWAWVTNGTNSTDLFASWPGVQVTKDITGWWSYTFENIPEGQLNIIWNDFGSYGYQTSDISNITSNTCFKLTGKSYYQVVTCQDTLHLANVANYIDFQALSAAYPAMTATTITSTNTYTLPNGSVLRGWLNPETSAEASNTWNVKENYNTVIPTPEMNGVEALRAGTMFRAASHTFISLGAFNMPSDGKLTVYFQPNGDSNRGVSITVGDNTYDFMKSGVKIDGTRPAYAAEVDLPAGYYMNGSVVITALSNTINIFGVRISPEPEVVLSNDLTVAEAITLGNQLGNNTLSEDSVSVIGYVVSAQPFDMAFGNQSFYIADAPNGEQTMQAYRAIPMKDGALYPVLVGDLVRIKGKLQHYVNANTSEDFVELYQPSVSFLTEVDGDRSLPAVPVINVTQALQRGNELSVGYRTSTVYDIVGYVTNIVEDAVSTYGNMTFWISDTQNGAASNAEGGFYVYRGATGKSLQVGDQVRVRTYIRNTSVLIDNSNVIASAASVPVTFLCQSMSNVNISKVWPIILDNTTYSAWNGKIQYDFRQNDENCFFYIWDNTYSSISSGSGLNFYGNYDGYWRFVVGTQDWAGGGLYLGNNPALTAEALRQAIVAHPEKYYLHMAVKATDNYTHAFYVFNNEGAAFELGDHSAYGHEVRQNFTRNGEWQEIYVPLSDYVNAFAATDMSNNPNLFVILSEAVQGAQIDLDAVFICEIGEATPQPAGTPTAEDLVAAGYDTTNNIVMAFKFDDAPCYDVVITGTYMMNGDNSWITDPDQLVHMLPLTGFDGWYAAQIPYYGNNDQAKPVQLSDVGAFNWDFQAGDSWTYRGGNYPYVEQGYSGEVNVYYYSPGAYIYEIEYWKNHNNPCTSLTTTYDVYLNAPANAPESVEMIGSFDDWTGIPMTYNSQLGMWYVQIQAVPTDEFKFRTGIGADDNTKWNNQIQSYDAENDTWSDLPNLLISQHLSSENVVYVDYSNSSLYRWTLQPEQPGEWFIDWNNLPEGYVFEAVRPQDAAYQALKSVKVYADTTYIHMLIEPDLNELPDLGWVPLDIYLNTDNSDNTGGNNTIFIDAYADVLLEGGVFIDGEFAAYDPYGYKWWGAAGETSWNYWVDPNTNHDGSDCWGALVCEGQWNGAISSQYINGKIEMKLLRSAIPATWNKTQFGIGFNLMSTSWETYGVLPIGSPTDENPNGLTNMMTVRMYGASEEPTSTYYVYLNAPENAPASIEVIGTFDNWIGTAMTNQGGGLWSATIQAYATDQFKFRQAGTWDNEIQVYDGSSDSWMNLGNLPITYYLINDSTIYADFSSTSQYRWKVPVTAEPIQLTISSITSEFYTEDNDIWYRLSMADGDNYFTVDIIVPDGMQDVELGHVYTWSDMLQLYCGGQYNGARVTYSDAQFVKTQASGGVQISVLITATSGQQYMLTYTGADVSPFDYDAETAYSENFSDYSSAVNGTNKILVSATQDDDATLRIEFNVPEGCDTLAAGTYTINATGNPMTVKASEGFVSGITTSWAGYYDGNGYIDIPVWYLVSGTVTVAADGTINVNALNSKGYAVQCQLSKPQVTTYQVYFSAPANAPDSVEIIGSFSSWSTGVQMTYNTDLGMWYATIQAAATDEFKFRQVGTWSNQIQVYDADNEWWSDCSNLIISEHLSGSNIVYVDYSNSSLYRWTVQPEQPGNWFIDWNNLPAGYVFEAVCPQDASYQALKSVKVYADTTYIHILVEPDLNELPDLSWVPFHIYLNTDNSNATGGSRYPFIDANTDILLEGAVFAEGEFSEYNPLVYKWWGEVGGEGWYWTDPSVSPTAENCWAALVCEGQLYGVSSQYINGKIEIQLLRSAIPATWNKSKFGIGFDIQQNWDPVGILPILADTDENPSGVTSKMTITMYGASEPVEPTSTYYVYLNAPEHAPSAIEVIGSFDGWTGTAMTTDGSGLWYATIQATPSTQFKFREAGNWNNEIQFYDAANGWYNPDNLVLRDYLIDTINNFVYANFSDTTLYRWRVRPVPITPDPIELTINSITSQFYNEDNDIWYKLYLADEENYFAIDIIVPEGMQDVELGQVYTWENMLKQYCGGYYNGYEVSFSDVQFVKTQATGGVIITALVTATTGQKYMLTYTGADATPFDFDAGYAYSENFSGYTNYEYTPNQRRVVAQNDNNGYIDLVFNVPEGCDSLAVGTYTINATGDPMTVQASEGFASGATPSFAGYVTSGGYVDAPYWYMVSGTVIVAADGTITVNALNSKGYTVQSQLTKAQVQPSDAPTESDLIAAGYDTDNNIVLAYKFDVAPCYDVVVAGNYATTATGGWVEDPAVLIHMEPLTGFDGWYAAQFPYFDGAQAKPVQLSSEGAFSWNYQAGNSWIYRGGNDATIESGYDGEVNVYYESAGAYIYEIKYWKNGNNPCEELVNTINVYFKAPANAPDSIEIIGSFGNGWSAGTLMTYDLANDWWYAQIQATPSDEFKFRQAGTWDNEIQVYNAENAEWLTCGNLTVSNYLSNGVMFIDFSGSDFRWSAQATDTRYIPYNLQAVSVPGRVEFSWDVDVVSDQYKLHIYDVNSTAAYYLTIYGTSTYVYAVEDFLDGMEFRWSIEPIAPYDLDEVFADSTILMQKSAVELSGFNLTTVDSITLDLTWQTNTESLLYRVEVDYNGYIIREETVNLKEYHFTSKLPGWHQVYVQPLNANGEAVGRYAYAGEINLARVPEPFSNLQGAANEHELTFTWNKVVDSVYVQIFRMVDGEFSDYIYHAPTAGNSMVYTVNEDGNYALQLRAYLEVRPGEYETVSYAKYITVQAFSVSTYSIQIDAAEGGYIWPDLSGEYPLGYTLKATAQPYEGYRFIGWSDGNTEQERTITVQGAMSITALFEQMNVYTLTVQASEGGQVYVSYLGDYTTLYSETLYEGTYIQLRARPVDGYAFYQWSDGVTDAERYVTVNADVNLTAIFMPYRHLTVSVNDASMGQVTVTGNYDLADGVYTAAHGTALTLIAQPKDGYHFAGWSDGVQTVQRIVNLTEDKSLTAIFAINTAPVVQYNITVSATDGGSVNDVSGTYNAGDMIELIATPKEGYEFVRWSDGVTTNPRPMTVSENKQLTAIFQIRTFTVTILAGQGGTVSGQVSGTFNYGTTISFAAKANEHYRFTAWSDGVTDASRSIRLVQDTALVATFAAIPSYTLSLTAGQGGQIRVGNEAYATSFNRAYDENTPVVIEAKADADYAFLRWSDGNTNAIRVITMNKNQTLTAEFQQLVKLTIFTSGNGTVEVQGDATASGNVYSAVSGTILTLTAKPAEGYRFTGWSDNVQAITRVITLTETKLLVANFEQATTTTQYNVSVGTSGTGTGTVNGKTSLQGQYYDGDQIELTAVAGALSEFAGWSDGVTTNPRTLVVSQDTTITAIFNIVPVVEQYTIVFKNYDGTVLDSAKWNAGETPVCPVTPTRPADEDNTYTFSGWSPAIVPAAADAVYTATYEATPVTPPTFTVTFYDWDDTVLDTQTVVKGGNATPPADPTREGYVFKGWDGNYTNVQHNEAVWATYEPAKEGFEDVVGDAAPQKVMINGVIYILRGGKTYTINGQEIKE